MELCGTWAALLDMRGAGVQIEIADDFKLQVFLTFQNFFPGIHFPS
jgi:hypothetical protein